MNMIIIISVVLIMLIVGCTISYHFVKLYKSLTDNVNDINYKINIIDENVNTICKKCEDNITYIDANTNLILKSVIDVRDKIKSNIDAINLLIKSYIDKDGKYAKEIDMIKSSAISNNRILNSLKDVVVINDKISIDLLKSIVSPKLPENTISLELKNNNVKSGRETIYKDVEKKSKRMVKDKNTNDSNS